MTAGSPGASFPLHVLDAILCGSFVLGIENIVFGLIPLRFLDGHDLLRWRSPYWTATYLLGAFGFIHVLLHPKTAPTGTTNAFTVSRAAILFVAFGLASIAFWGYFRVRDRQQRRRHQGWSTSRPSPR